jgi:hypothetical protein
MTNVTLSIEESVYNQMKEYSEIKWSEFIRKCIQKRIEELHSIRKSNNESFMTMIASEEVLKKDWSNKLDERWNNV